MSLQEGAKDQGLGLRAQGLVYLHLHLHLYLHLCLYLYLYLHLYLHLCGNVPTNL